MTGDPDEDCISNKELRDFMKVMTELFTKNQASTPLQHLLPQQVIVSFHPFRLMMVLILINILLGK
jgi:hypothetical protein